MTENEKTTTQDEDDLKVIPETLDDDEKAPQVEDKSVVELLSGSDLTVEDLAAFRLSRPVRSVALVGAHRSGKTTLVSELYSAFCEGPFGGFTFAGSRTLEGFERRLHDARVQSGRTAADTRRTSIASGLAYLHLSLVGPDQRQIDLAWADRAGESFETIQSAQSTEEIPLEIARSAHVTLLLDGARLADVAERQNAIQETYLTLRKLVALGAVDHSQNIEIVTTKVDLLLDPELRRQATYLQNRLREQCGTIGDSIAPPTFHETSVRTAMPSSGDGTPRLGLGELLRCWAAEAPKSPERIEQPPLSRPYHQYLNMSMDQRHD